MARNTTKKVVSNTTLKPGESFWISSSAESAHAKDVEKISFGNMIKCHYNNDGEIIGFDIRDKIINLMF